MSTSEEEKFYSSNNEEENKYEDYPSYLATECSPEEEDFSSIENIYPRWKRVPRTAAAFSESKTSITSCRDSDYEKWLENYYEELFHKQTKPCFEEKQTDIYDLIEEQHEKVETSFFQEIKKNVWSSSTKYWSPKDVRRHWPLRKSRNEYLYFPSAHPHLNLRSRYGRFHSLLNSAAAIPEANYKALICRTFKKTLQSLESNSPQLLKIINCDDLCNFKWFDFMTKTAVMRCLCRFLRTQYRLEKVSFENADLTRLEGIILLCALSRKGGDRIKELHIWKMFGYGQCPVLENDLSQKKKSFKEKKTSAFFTKVHFLQILNNFSVLTHLSLNYAYLANQKGNALLCLKCVRIGCLKELRLLCLKDERPFLTNPGYGVGGWSITDGVWRRVAEWCPDLRVKFVFANMAQYENIILFLSKSIPVSYIYISSGYDFNFEVPWDVDSTLLELRNWYASTLDTLCLHLWHHRDLLDFVIQKKILEEFPNLITFEFIGILENVETLEFFCCQLSKGIYRLKSLLFWVEEKYSGRKNKELTTRRVAEIREKYRRRFQVNDIDADIGTYPL